MDFPIPEEQNSKIPILLQNKVVGILARGKNYAILRVRYRVDLIAFLPPKSISAVGSLQVN